MSDALRVRSFFLILVLCALASVPVFAQMETATLSGAITDPKGGVVPDVEVTATRIETGAEVTTKTNGAGIYFFTGLMPGHYHLMVHKPGFKEIAIKEFQLNVQDKLEQNFSLEIGSVSETVTVTANDININTTDASVSTVVDQHFIESIPLNGRSLQPLLTLTPGVILTPVATEGLGQFSVNGQRADANYFTVDGVSANVGVDPSGGAGQSAAGTVGGFNAFGGTNSLVSIDAIQEFRIETSSYAPEFGRTPGGQISIVTRSGTNQFHGDVFDYFRNDVLDANDWFADENGLPKAALRQNDFGGVFGGPINKDNTFFFVSYEGLRLVQPETAITTVPTVAFRQSAPANVQPLLNALPIPNGTDFGNGTAEFDGVYSNPTTLNATSFRVDQKLGRKITLFGRYNYAPSHSIQRLPSYSTLFALDFGMQTLTLGSSQLLSASATNDIRFNYSLSSERGNFSMDSFGGAVVPSLASFTPPSVSPASAYVTFGVSTDGSFNLGKFSGNSQKQINLVDSLSVSRGTHQLKFGVDYRRLSPTFNAIGYQQTLAFFGLTGFGGVSSTLPFVNIAAANQVGMVFNNFSTYAQDTWKLNPRLTLTYGLRWELNPAFHGASGTPLYAIQNINDLSNLTLAPAGAPFFKTTYYNFAPRLGVAYQLSPKPGYETVFRAGGGIFYDLGAGALANGSAYFPYLRQANYLLQSVPFPVPAAQATAPPFSTTIPPGGVPQTTATEPHLQLPRTYEWNVALEQSLGRRQTISLTYLGALGRQLLNRDNLSFPSGSEFQDISVTTNNASSDFNAMQLQYQLRLTRGLQALGYYSWSHSIDTLSTDMGSSLSDPNINRGNSDFDIRNAFHAAVTYDIPTAPLGALGRAIVKNWSVDANIAAQSAIPVDLHTSVYLYTSNLLASTEARPDVVAGVPLYLYGAQCTAANGGMPCPGGKAINFTPGAVAGGCPDGTPSVGPFCNPPVDPTTGLATRQGNLGRNTLRGFGVGQLDFALRRKFNLTERLNLQFSTEFFNILNHPNFGAVDNCTCDSPGFFGQATMMLSGSLAQGGTSGGFNPLYQVGGPRSIQFALRLAF
jgi:hypothetical protein